MLGQIFKIIGSRKAQKIISSKKIKNTKIFVLCLKIMFTGMFFDLDSKFVVNDLKNSEKLKKFFEVEEVPEISYIQNYFSKITEEQLLETKNRILNQFKTFKRRKSMIFIVDATPVDLDFNTHRKKRAKNT